MIRKNPVTTGIVRLTKHVTEREEVVNEPVYSERVEIERVPVNRRLDQPAESRYEGNTLVIPVMEEILVVEKRIMLKEEVPITRLREEQRNSQPVTLRQEEITVERVPPNRTVE